ncbi:MAG: carboxyl transferase domain-containing protein [Rubrivivax sp.]
MQARRAAAVPGRRHRLHGGARGRARRHRQGGREVHHRDVVGQRAEVHRDHRRLVRRRLPRRCAGARSGRTRCSWPNARAAIMGPEQAATTLALVREQILQRSGQTWSDAEREAFKQPIRDEYERFASAYNFASRLWIDGVLDPLETRPALTLLLEAASRTPSVETRLGVMRM